MFETGSFEFKQRLIHLFLLLAALLVLYLTTMPKAITLEDAGIFQMVCHLGGISHPPGYPLFTQVCQDLMFTESVIWANLVSTYFALGAVVVLYLVVLELKRDHLVALVAAFTYGLSQCFWSQAIIVEVYTMAAFQFLLCWWLLLRFTRMQSLAIWYLLCLNVGLALSNHWPLFVLSCLGFVSLLWRHQKLVLSLITLRIGTISALMFLLGLAPYLLLFQPEPVIAMYGEVSTRNFIPYLLREYYSDDHAAATIHDKLQFARWMIPLTSLQLGWFALPFVLLGFFLAPKQLRKEDTLSILLIFVATTFLLVGLLNFRFEFQTQAVFLPYPIIAVSVVCVLFSLGFMFVMRALHRVSKVSSLILALILLTSVVAANYPEVNRSNSLVAEEYARVVLGGLEEDAVLFVGGDNEVGPIGFVHRIQEFRPDVSVHSVDGLLFREKIVPRKSSSRKRLEHIREYAQTSGRPIYTLARLTDDDTHFGLFYLFQGNLSKETVTKTSNEDEEFSLDLTPQNIELRKDTVLRSDVGRFTDYLLNLYIGGLINNHHEKIFIHSLLVEVTEQYSFYAQTYGTSAMSSDQLKRLSRLQATLPGKMSSLRTLLLSNSQSDELLELGLALESQLHESIANQHDALAYEFIARVYLGRGNTKAAAEYFIKSVKALPSLSNASLCSYLTLVGEREFDQNFSSYDFETESCKP